MIKSARIFEEINQATAQRIAQYEHKICVTLSLLILAIGLVSLWGILNQYAFFYLWGISSKMVRLEVVYAVILLASGYLIFCKAKTLSPGSSAYKIRKLISALCFMAVFGIFILETMQVMQEKQASDVNNLFIPFSPEAGITPLARIMGLFIASITALVYLLGPQTAFWTLLGVQLPGVFLASFGIVALMHFVIPITYFNLLFSVPGSLAMFLFGLLLMFSRAQSSLLMRPFFASYPHIRLYTVILCVAWVALAFWQSYIWHSYAINLPLEHSLLLGFDFLIDLTAAICLSFILGASLHVIGTLERDTLLIDKLQESMDNHALLAATLSHDLKAPIQTEINALEMLQQGLFGGPLPHKAERLISTIKESSRFELELVTNLVDLLRYEINEAQFEPQALNSTQTLAEIYEEFSPLALQKNLQLVMHTIPEDDSQTAILFADQIGLKRVFYNLINNVFQHLGPEHRIDIGVQHQETEWLFFVQDNGPGIPLDIQSKLFRRFSRGPEVSPAAKTTGSGLGLYVSKQIVERHGGRIWVKSEVNQGTTFYFTIPDLQPEPSAFQVNNKGKATYRRILRRAEVI